MSKITTIVDSIITKVNEHTSDISDLTTDKANLLSPNFTGTPTLNGEALVKLSSDGLRIEKSNDATIKNQCTAWVNFDGTTTPPTIRDSYNVSSVVRTEIGKFDVYFLEAMDNTSYTVSYSLPNAVTPIIKSIAPTVNKVSVQAFSGGTFYNLAYNDVHIFGGKNS